VTETRLRESTDASSRNSEARIVDGEPTPVLIIDQIEAIEQPAQPYLYG
jgi:uncharacterized membrane protein YcgQ (UPF0703/DUF1980 family)